MKGDGILELMAKGIEYILESLKGSPATLVLLLVCYAQFKIQERRDADFKALVEGQIEDAERQGKMITLLEVLVSQGRTQ
jgi:hypothetical protein